MSAAKPRTAAQNASTLSRRPNSGGASPKVTTAMRTRYR
jgi:hypothetical protein